MTKRRLTLVLAIPALLAGLLAGILYLVMHTSTGAGWVLAGLQGQLPGKLTMAEVKGDFGSGLQLRNFSYVDPGLSVTAEQINLAISLDILPMAIRVDSLNIQSLELVQLLDEPGQTAPADALSSLALPLPVYLDDLLLEGLVYSDPDSVSLFVANRLAVIARIHDHIRLDKFELDMDLNRFLLDGSLGLAEPFPIEMNLKSKLSLDLEDTGKRSEFDIQTSLRGNLDQKLELELASKQPAVIATGTLHDLLNKPEWQLGLESPGLWWPPDSEQGAEVRAGPLKISSSGRIDDFSLNANGQLQLSGLDSHQIDLQARGTATGMEIHQLELQGPALNLSTTGELSWQEGLETSLASTVNYLNPNAWLSNWPEGHPVNGKLVFSMQEQRLQISHMHFEAADLAMTLDGSGDVDLELGTLASEIAWKDVAWPPESEKPDIRSRLGRFLLSGTLDNWNVAGEAELETPDLAPGTLQLKAAGDRKHATMTIVEGRILGGTVHGDAEFDWSGGGSWSASLVTKGIETQELSSALPGAINADLTALGKLEPFHLDLDIRKLDGEIRGKQLTARGRIKVQPGNLEFIDVHLNSLESMMSLQGSTASADGVAFTADIADLGSFLAHSSGSIEAGGRLSLKTGNPKLRLNLEGKDLAWEDIHLPQISIHDYAEPAADDIALLHLEAKFLQFDEQILDSVSLDLDVSSSAQAVRLALLKSGLELTASLDGSTRFERADPGRSEWTGQLRTLTLSKEDQAILTLLDPADVELSATRAEISHACLGAGADSSLCLEAGWKKGNSFSTRAKLAHFPINLIQILLDTELEPTQFADGELAWNSTASGPPGGHATIHLSPGEVRYSGEDEPLFQTGQGLVGFELTNGSLTAGNFDIPLPGVGEIDLDFNMPDVTAGLDSEITGKLKIALNDLDLVTIFVPVIDQADGRLDADLSMSGSPLRPYFDGQLSLTDGLVFHEASGLRLSDIQLSGKVIRNYGTRMTGSFRAREGTGHLQATLDISDILSPRVELNLQGENLTLLDAADLKVVAEPDIQLAWQEGIIEIDGSLLIPSARIAPRSIPESTVSTSPDLVIVAGEIPRSVAEADEEPDIAIRGGFEVTLGDEVELDLSVAVAQVDGSVKFTWKDDLLPLANGNYHMTGEIQAFGQLLQISEANIGFPGVPADNPHLNIRAERQIYGNSEIRRAGVFVTGTLRRPIIEPYTDPMTNRERAQTLLITGSDFNMETGVGAVDIGTYIAPRIFVSYGIGVFEDENVISIRYDLGRNWGIKATSGQRQTGLDISYTIER
jgi:translocation and assembly module TamB